MEKQNTKYFSYDELKKLQSLEGKTLTDVIYFVWINRINQANPFVFVDKLQLKFSDGTFVTFSAGEESDALQFVEDFDPAAEALRLDKEFQGRIILKPHNSSKDKFWNDVVGQVIEAVQLSSEGDTYLADAIVLNFGTEKRLIGISPEEGILIDFFEE